MARKSDSADHGSARCRASPRGGVRRPVSGPTVALLEEATGTETWVKHENHNPTGAFKVRGGLNLVSRLVDDGPVAGLISASRGNHSQSADPGDRTPERLSLCRTCPKFARTPWRKVPCASHDLGARPPGRPPSDLVTAIGPIQPPTRRAMTNSSPSPQSRKEQTTRVLRAAWLARNSADKNARSSAWPLKTTNGVSRRRWYRRISQCCCSPVLRRRSERDQAGS